MAYARTDAARSFIRGLPEAFTKRILPGAARAAAKVIAEEAKRRSISDEVADAVQVRGTTRDGLIVGKVQVKGPGAYLAPWQEYGTAPHFISVAEEQREGRSVKRINRLVREGSLVIGGNFVGGTVHHPGARPHPFLRPALDDKEAEAVAAAQTYVNSRLSKAGLAAPSPADDAE